MKTNNIILAVSIFLALLLIGPFASARHQVSAAAMLNEQHYLQGRPTLTPEPEQPERPSPSNTPWRPTVVVRTRTATPTNTAVATLVIVTATGRPRTATPRPTITPTVTQTPLPPTPTATATFLPTSAETEPAGGMNSVLRAACLPNLLVAGLLGLFVLIWLIRKSR